MTRLELKACLLGDARRGSEKEYATPSFNGNVAAVVDQVHR
jgi:hypothetical protein